MEPKSVTPRMINAWSETSLPALLSNYDLKDIYNGDEFRLFLSVPSEQNIPAEVRKVLSGKAK